MKKKKLCLVIPSLQAGGMERVMSELAGYFSTKNETEVHLVLYGITRELFYPVPENLIIHKPDFVFNNRYRLFYTIKTLSFLRHKIKAIHPDSILSFGEYWNNFFLLSTLGISCKKFVSDRSQPDKSLGTFHDVLRKWLYPTATGLIFQTQKARQIFLRSNRHPNTTVIGNPIKESVLNPDAIREKNILMVGRLIKSKNQDKLIEIFANVAEPGWKLIFVGYDHLKQQNMDNLKKLAKDLGVEDSVVFTGKQDNLNELYTSGSIFAFTSSSEGFPNVIGEAMSAGLPVIAYDCIAGPSEMIVDGENGFLIPLFNNREFEMKLSILMRDEPLRKKMGANARESIRRFSHAEICDAFYRFIMN